MRVYTTGKIVELSATRGMIYMSRNIIRKSVHNVISLNVYSMVNYSALKAHFGLGWEAVVGRANQTLQFQNERQGVSGP